MIILCHPQIDTHNSSDTILKIMDTNYERDFDQTDMIYSH